MKDYKNAKKIKIFNHFVKMKKEDNMSLTKILWFYVANKNFIKCLYRRDRIYLIINKYQELFVRIVACYGLTQDPLNKDIFLFSCDAPSEKIFTKSLT